MNSKYLSIFENHFKKYDELGKMVMENYLMSDSFKNHF